MPAVAVVTLVLAGVIIAAAALGLLRVIGHLVAHRGGHALHTAFAAQVLEESDAWTLVEAPMRPQHADVPAAVAVKEPA